MRESLALGREKHWLAHMFVVHSGQYIQVTLVISTVQHPCSLQSMACHRVFFYPSMQEMLRAKRQAQPLPWP
jgi:hypothetical protein